jgi:hypothetical protein
LSCEDCRLHCRGKFAVGALIFDWTQQGRGEAFLGTYEQLNELGSEIRNKNFES